MKPVLPEPERFYHWDGAEAEAYAADTVQSINDAAYKAGMRDAVPEGWKVVPVEPTREMRNAAIFEQELHRSAGLGLYGDEPASTIYKAMLSASPELKK